MRPRCPGHVPSRDGVSTLGTRSRRERRRLSKPVSAGSSNWDHDFVGRTALQRQQRTGIPKQLVGLKLAGRRVPRPGYDLRVGDSLGAVASGNFSPVLGCGIGMGYVAPPTPSTDVAVDIRGRGTMPLGSIRRSSKCEHRRRHRPVDPRSSRTRPSSYPVQRHRRCGRRYTAPRRRSRPPWCAAAQRGRLYLQVSLVSRRRTGGAEPRPCPRIAVSSSSIGAIAPCRTGPGWRPIPPVGMRRSE